VGLWGCAGQVGDGDVCGSGDVATDGGAGNSGRSWEKGLRNFSRMLFQTSP